MGELFSRSELLWGKSTQENIASKSVCIFGLGGVGSYATEALARSGVGRFVLVDFDVVSESNINRQLVALHSSVGQKKTHVMQKRILDINPDAQVKIVDDFYREELNDKLLLFNKPDFVVDAIDTMKSKIELLSTCYENKIPVISSLGAGNRLKPEMFDLFDLSELRVRQNKKCTFTKNVLYQLEKRGIVSGIPFVASDEPPIKVAKVENIEKFADIEYKKITPASVAFVPPVAGMLMAGYVVRSFLDEK